MASDPPASSRAHQPRAGPQPAHAPTAGEAASPPSKASLKQWWKNFSKPPNKGQEQNNGSLTPFHTRGQLQYPRNPRILATSWVVEDLDDVRLIVQDNEKQMQDAEERFGIPKYSTSYEDQEFRLLLWPHNSYSSQSLLVSVDLSELPYPVCKQTKFWLFIETLLPVEYFRRLQSLRLIPAQAPTGIFGVPLRQSITYANVAISLVDGEGRSYIYGYVPIVVAKCGVFLKEKGMQD